MLARVHTCALHGVDATSVEVEVEVRNGPDKFTIIGLGDSTVRESRDRVISAIRHSGFFFPKQVLVNLAPAEVRKEGSSFDLAIALGILIASRQVSSEKIRSMSFHGELALDGKIKGVRGALALAIESLRRGHQELVVPASNGAECELVQEIVITPVATLIELIHYLHGASLPVRNKIVTPDRHQARALEKSFHEVRGQEAAKYALLVAAVGNHNTLMIGPPGCGKSMLAERFVSLLPPLARSEMLEAVRIHSVAGNPVDGLLSGMRPFRNPHHIVSDAGLIGGGSIPRPGEISLAHRGVLFLDELPEFRRSAIEALRVPLELRQVQVTRARAAVSFPAAFQLLAAMNPCPCGRLGMRDERGVACCMCSRTAIAQYLKKLSQPILDRIDLHVELEPVSPDVLVSAVSESQAAGSPYCWQTVSEARERQYARSKKLNSDLSPQELTGARWMKRESLTLLEHAAKKALVSARGFFRVLRVARTLADLDRQEEVGKDHVAQALNYRGLERLHRYVAGVA